MNKIKIVTRLFMLLSLLLLLVLVFKIAFWLSYDVPISRGSVLIILVYSFSFLYRNKITFLVLVMSTISCIVFKLIYLNWSGYLPIDLMASMRNYGESVPKSYILIPYLFYILIFILLFLPITHQVYRLRNT